MKKRSKCEVCGFKLLMPKLMGSQTIKVQDLTADSLRVTNKDYGICVETVMCENCGLIQPEYELDLRTISDLYSNINDEEYLMSSYLRGISNYNQISQLLSKYISYSSKILEVGAGSGALFKLLKDDYPNIKGIEPSTAFCNFAEKNYKVSIKNISYQFLNGSNKYDAIIAFDVIEHVTSPDDFMRVISAILNSNGIAIIVTPNRSSLTARIMKKKWWHIRPPHLFYFNDINFSLLAQKYGFKIIKKKMFYWSLPFNYILDSIQKLIFKKAILNFEFLSFNVKINAFDSRLYVLQKPAAKETSKTKCV